VKWISTKVRLPPEGIYVLARHNRGTWYDDTDQDNVNCVVVKLSKGLSIDERAKMESGELPSHAVKLRDGLNPMFVPRWRIRQAEDEGECGNSVPYCWKEFGPDCFTGQSITHWMPIKPIAKKHSGSQHYDDNGDE